MSSSDLSRRQFLKYAAMTGASVSGGLFLYGCAIDPVTGKKQLMMVSPQQEIGIDRQHAPFQFSADYGVCQDASVNTYVADVGQKLLPMVHRPSMPYNFQCVNATYINAYAFPGGTIAVTRGILLELENEAQLAALLGHELGHVNARHSAEQMSKGQLSSLLVGGLTIAAGSQSAGAGELVQQLGSLGQGLLLSKYSRDNEREADALGNAYMVKSGYPSQGFVMLMEMLDTLNKGSSSAVQVLFSTHPMSNERLSAAVNRATGVYDSSKNQSLGRERYMDHLEPLRKKKKGIAQLQEGEKYMGKKEYDQARKAFQTALKTLDNDYTAHVLMAKCLMLRKDPSNALTHAELATRLYPSEAQGYYVAGLANTELEKWTAAYRQFERCDKALPGNPQLTFLKGFSQDKNGQIRPAATHYQNYLKMINYQPNPYSKYAYARLKAWGVAQ